MDEHANPQQLRTVDEVAAVLSVSRSTMMRLIKRGAIPHLKVGGSLRIRQRDLDRYIDTRADHPDDAA